MSSLRLPVTFALPTKTKDSITTKILAIDLGKFNSACCIYNAKTRKAKFATNPTTREHFKVSFEDCGADLVVMEACGPSGWINDLAQSFCLTTLICSTNEEAWRWANVKRKTDKDDALKLARMAATGELNHEGHEATRR